MSNFRAVAAVTATLRYLLHEAVKDVLPEADITTRRPEEEPTGGDRDRPRINVFLFQSTINPTHRNADLPTRTTDGQLVKRPQVALNLHYLLTFFGDAINSHLLLGLATTALHDSAYLSPALIRDATAGKPELQGSAVDAQEPPVRITPLTFSFDEFSKFWSGFFQIPYSLSVAYQAAVLLMESDVGVPVAALPVHGVQSAALRQPMPTLSSIEPVSFASPDAIGAGSRPDALAPVTVAVSGESLAAGDVLEVAGTLLTVHRDARGALSVTVPPTLTAGLHPIRVGTTLPLGRPPRPHTVLAATGKDLAIRPVVLAVEFAPASRTLTVQVAPPVAPRQRLAVSLVATSATSPASPPRAATPPSATVTEIAAEATSAPRFAVPSGLSGVFLVQLSIDGVDSALATDASGRLARPQVTIS